MMTDESRHLAEWDHDVTPPTTALYVAAGLAIVVLFLLGWSTFMTSGYKRIECNKPISPLWKALIESEYFTFHTIDMNGNFTTQLLAPVCLIPPLIVLAGLQYDFWVTLTVYSAFPALLLLISAAWMVSTRKGILKKYKANEKECKDNRILQQQLRTFQIQTLFADPDEPIARVLLIGLSQMLLLGFYVWGLWDAGRPDFSDRRIYGYYYAGVFLQMAYVVGKARTQQSEKKKAHDSRRRDSVPTEDPVTYQSVFYHCAGFWAYYTGGVYLYKDDFAWATQGNELNRASCNVRYILDLIVNTAGVFYIMMGLPIQVSHDSNPIDFVLNVVAAFYIVELDDCDDKVVKFPPVRHATCDEEAPPSKQKSDAAQAAEAAVQQALRDSNLEEAKDILMTSMAPEDLVAISRILNSHSDRSVTA